MYNIKTWIDHVVQRPKTYTVTDNADGTKTLTDAPGSIVQQGTPMSATNFNAMEGGIADAHTAKRLFLQFWLNFRRWIEAKVTELSGLIAGNTASIGVNASAITALQTGAATSATNIGKLEADDTPEIKTVALTNSQKWPFNNSLQTVALTTNRPTTNYTVDAEIKAVAGGTIQGVKISDRLANGFKVAYEGDATSATLKLIIKGGINR